MIRCLSDIVNENCLLTLSQINKELRCRLPNRPEVHILTISRTLQGMLYRVKLARPLPPERNRPDGLQRRRQYARWFMRHAVVSHCVFVDECGYHIWTARTQERARAGERAYRQVCGQRGRDVMVVLPISPTNGLVFHLAIIAGMNAGRFSDLYVAQQISFNSRSAGNLNAYASQ